MTTPTNHATATVVSSGPSPYTGDDLGTALLYKRITSATHHGRMTPPGDLYVTYLENGNEVHARFDVLDWEGGVQVRDVCAPDAVVTVAKLAPAMVDSPPGLKTWVIGFKDGRYTMLQVSDARPGRAARWQDVMPRWDAPVTPPLPDDGRYMRWAFDLAEPEEFDRALRALAQKHFSTIKDPDEVHRRHLLGKTTESDRLLVADALVSWGLAK